MPLAVLIGVWLAGRAAVFGSVWIGTGIAAALDLSFLALLLVVVLREIMAGRNWRNLPMPIVLVGLLVANALTHADAAGIGWALPTGRLWPFLVPALMAWGIAPESPLAAAALVLAGLATLIRLVRWRGPRTLAEPLVWSLHFGFAWIPVGLLLTGLAVFLREVPQVAGIHALSAGAMGGMTLAVMTRATLGHTGRPLSADRWTAAIYLMVAAAATLRVGFAVRYGRLLLSR